MVKKSDKKRGASKKSIGETNKIPTMKIISDRDIAMDFSVKVYKKFQKLVKSIIYFGSSAKQETKPNSDIDLVILIDDVSISWNEELISTYREELSKIVQTNPYIKSLHINTVKLSTWWKDLMIGDPVVLNVLRYGEALIDDGGFFAPQKALLLAGKIKPTPEAIYNLLERVPVHMNRARVSYSNIVDAYYWACLDSSHAAIMSANITPPSPEHIVDILEENFVRKKMLSRKFVDTYLDVYSLMKDLSHGNITRVPGKTLDDLKEKTESFISEMVKLSERIIRESD